MKSDLEDSGAALVGQAAEGDAGAAAALFERYGDSVYRYVSGCGVSAAEAEDITQDVFLRALTAGRGFRGGGSLGGWLLRIARRRLIDRARSERSRRSRESEWAQTRAEAMPSEVGPDPLLKWALGALSLEEREIIVLTRFLELPSARVAEILEITPGAARVRLHRALARLAELYHCKEASRE